MTAGNLSKPSHDKEQAQPLIEDRCLSLRGAALPYYVPGARHGDLKELADGITRWTREAIEDL